MVAFSAVAERLEDPTIGQFNSPGDLALHVDAHTVQTAALDLLDKNLIDVATGQCKRLIFSMPPQEGKANAPAAASLSGCWCETRTCESQSSPTNSGSPDAGAGRSATTSPPTPN